MNKTIAVLILTCAGLPCAQEHKAAAEPQSPAVKKRLQSVTWDLTKHKLVWVVERGEIREEEFVPVGSQRYEIAPDEAVMQFSEERRGFSREEAVALHTLLDTLTRYCVESVIWWEQGQGDKLDGKEKPKKEQVEHPKKSPPPPNPEYLVAGLERAILRTLR
jgi:hypothetical protein